MCHLLYMTLNTSPMIGTLQVMSTLAPTTTHLTRLPFTTPPSLFLPPNRMPFPLFFITTRSHNPFLLSFLHPQTTTVISTSAIIAAVSQCSVLLSLNKTEYKTEFFTRVLSCITTAKSRFFCKQRLTVCCSG